MQVNHRTVFAALLCTAFSAALDEPSTPGQSYGQEAFTNPNAIWTPVSHSYSNGPYKQAVFISLDGLHQFDLLRLIAMYPNSTIASIMSNSVMYMNARAASPSDSFPATAALFTGASPRNSGIFWDDVYDRSLYPPGSNCKGPIGTEAAWDESDDLNSTIVTGGDAYNISNLPLQLTAWGSCQPVLPHNYLRVNTIFEVARGNGLVTAYADKVSDSGLSQSQLKDRSIANINVAASYLQLFKWPVRSGPDSRVLS